MGFPSPPNVGDVVTFAPLLFGDGTQAPNQNFTCIFVDIPNNWVLLQKVETHTYNGSGPFTASFSNCCRLSPPSHINNGDQNFRAETIINFAFTTANPISSLPAIVDCPREGVCSFQVPATDPDNQMMQYRLATSAEAGDGGFVQPGPPFAPNAATIDHTTGLYHWDTHGAQLNPSGDTFYSTQVMIENVDFTGRVLTKTPLDFFIRLIPVTNHPPVFIYPPTPPDNTLFTVLEEDAPELHRPGAGRRSGRYRDPERDRAAHGGDFPLPLARCGGRRHLRLDAHRRAGRLVCP